MLSLSFKAACAAACLLLSLPVAATPPGTPAPSASPAPANALQLVDALQKLAGNHPGQRRNHARGICAVGQFTATEAAAALTHSAAFSGQTWPVLARFSQSGGDPNASDLSRGPRGLALLIETAAGPHQMALLNTPMFGAATPETFLGMLEALAPDPGTGKVDPARIAAFRAQHPDTQAQATWLAEHTPPASFARESYHSLHAFGLRDANQQLRFVRFRLQPEDGIQRIDQAALASLPADYLQRELAQRLQRTPAAWTLWATLAREGDPLDDPSAGWTGEHEEVALGQLRLERLVERGDARCERHNFDPRILTAGVEPSNDPILTMRSAAYAISQARRLSEQPAR